MDSSMMGPGTHDGHLTSFGAGAKGISMGSKYEFKPDQNPGCGSYDIESALKYIKPKI